MNASERHAMRHLASAMLRLTSEPLLSTVRERARVDASQAAIALGGGSKVPDLARFIVDFLRTRNGGQLAAMIDRADADGDLTAELEMILMHGGKPSNWV